MMRKAGALVFIVLFFAACAVPGLGMLVLGESGGAANEKVARKPSLTKADGSWNLNMFSEASDYFSGNFAFRRELITADSAWKAGLFHTSSQKQVALGQDDWLFYAETLEDYTGVRTLSDRQVWCIARSLRLAQEYAAKQGAAFVFTVAPNKLSLYPEQYSVNLRRAEETGADKLQAGLETEGVAYADLFSAFSAQDEILYHRGDSHWTYRGAALAHDVLLEALGGLPEERAFDKPGSYALTHQGDLHVMLYPASQKREEQFVFDREPVFSYSKPVRSPEDLRIQTAGEGSGSLLMFRDSFGNTLHSLMAESFSQALFSRGIPYDLMLLDETAASAVVVEIVERNLPQLGQNAFVMPAPAVTLTEPVKDSGATVPGAVQPAGKSGLLRLSAIVEDSCDTDSPVYLELGGELLEASPVGEFLSAENGFPFTAYLPQNTELTDGKVLYRKNGQWMSAGLTASQAQQIS